MSETPGSAATGGDPAGLGAKPKSKADPARRGEWTIGVLRLLAFLSLIGGLILGVVVIAGAQNCDQSFLGSSTCDSTTVTILGVALIVGGLFWFTIYSAAAAGLEHIIYLRQKFEPFFQARETPR